MEMARETPPDSPRAAWTGELDSSGEPAVAGVPEDFLGLGAALDLAGPASAAAPAPGPKVAPEGPPAASPEASSDLASEQADASWLMEFEDEDFADDPFGEPEDTRDEDARPVGGGKLWAGRALIALISLVAGALGARWYQGVAGSVASGVQVVAVGSPAAPAERPGAQARPPGAEPVAPTAPAGSAQTSELIGIAQTGESLEPVQSGEPIEIAQTGGSAEPAASDEPVEQGEAVAPATLPGAEADSTTGEPLRPARSAGPVGPLASASAPPSIGAARGAPRGPRPDAPPAPVHGPRPAGVGESDEALASRPLTPASRALRTLSIPLEEMVLLPAAKGAAREADATDLADLWPTADIPLGRVDDERRLLTPKVGRVRVNLLDGAVFEGRLIAVGEGKVWLELDAGRLAVMGWQVERVEHLLSPEGTPAMGTPGSERLAGLPQVRVRTPGGVFYGKLLAHDDDRVTLITAEGARVTLDDAEVSPAGRSRSRLIGLGEIAADTAAETAAGDDVPQGDA
ncbi:MAG: hypothetical protein CMJ84_15520 [Planctomycetes bacterium]|jgi:hypothetical protein|nr:hypothetical protein [Planctomycetota bacterium]